MREQAKLSCAIRVLITTVPPRQCALPMHGGYNERHIHHTARRSDHELRKHVLDGLADNGMPCGVDHPPLVWLDNLMSSARHCRVVPHVPRSERVLWLWSAIHVKIVTAVHKESQQPPHVRFDSSDCDAVPNVRQALTKVDSNELSSVRV